MDNITKLPARFLLAATLILLPLAAHATNYYGGILNAALGNAVLSVQGTTMTVDNIGHSGNDGVRMDVGSASALDIQFFEYLKHQTCMVTIATSDAYAPFPVVSVGELFGGSNSYARADFSALGSTQSMMQVRDGNGKLLSSARVANAAWVSLDNLFPNPTNGIYVYQVQQGADFTWWRFCTPCLVCTEQVAVVERTLCFRPLDVRRRIPHISGLQLKALGDTAVTSLTLSNENLGLFGHFHHALGQARFDAHGDTLGVLNLGSSGNDGVAVLLGRDMNRLKARWNELDPAGAAPPGASFTMAARGRFTGGVQQTLGSMKVQKTAAGMALVNDFTGIGSQSALILVMRNGAQVASFRLNHNTPLPFTGGWPRSGTVGPRLTDLWPPYGPICFYEDWPIDVVLPVAGGSIVGNQIRVLIDDVPQSFAALEAVHFTLGGLPQLVLAGEESSPAGLIFDGLVHAPLGNATLQANARERLTVSGIGSNGTDGVRILTGGGGGASTKLGVFNPDLLPIDAFLHWAAIDPTDLTLEALTVRRTAAGGALYADFGGLGASTATVALYSNDVLLAYANGIPPTTPVLTFGGGGGLPINLDPCILHPEDCYGAIDIDIWQPDPIGPIASLVSLPGSGPARGTRVTIQPDPLPVAPSAIQVREIQVTGKNLGTMSLGNNFSVGVHFGANDPPPAGSALAPNDVAGAVPQAHWNNASGPIGSVSGLVGEFNGAAVATTLIVEWTSPNTWSSTGRGEENNGFPPGGDRLLMSGYLDTDNGPGVARVAVFGIDPITASTGYDVIVYILGGVGGRGGAYTIGGITKYGTAATNPSSHSEDPGLGLADNGTYVRFTGLTGSSFTLIADANTNSPNRNFRAPVNGIQIVRSRLTPPPPEGLVYFGLKHHVLGQAQYSFDTPGALAVENLGSSGNDGVDVQIQELVQSPTPGGSIPGIGSPRNAYSADWVALNPQPFPPSGGGGGLVFNAWGRLNGGPERLVAWVCQMFAGPSLQLVPDFSALGSGSQEIQLWRDGMLLTRYRVQNNTPAVTTAEWLSGLQLRPASGNFVPPYGPICFYGDWPIVVDVLTPSGQHFLANQVRIAIDDVPGSLDALTHVSLQMPGSQRLVFTRESASRVGLNFAGNQHFALGQARLSKTTTGALMMENIGPSGSDGMEIQLGRAGFCEVASPSLPLPPPDSSCRYDFRAVVDGLSDRTAATLTMGSAAAGGMQFAVDMSPLGATRYTMLVLDGESQVAGLSNQPVATLTISDSAVYAPSLRWDIQRYKCFIRIRVPKLPGNPGPLIRLGNGAPVSGDNVIILPDDPTRNLGPQTRVLLTATAVHPEPKLFVTEQLGLFAVGHTGLGDATLQARGGTLTIGNLGSNGNDGVALELERSRSFLASFAPLDFQTAQGPYPQPWIQARAFGRFSGMPDHDLGSLRFTALTTGVVRVEADFTPVGSSTHTIEIWRSGALMLRVAGHTGVVATVSAWPAGIGKLGGADPTVLPCYISPFGALVPITIGGGPTVDGDELRVLTGNPSGPIEELQRLQFQTSGFESFTIENEGLTPALTPRFSQISRLPGGTLQLTIPTVFGYNYSLEAVDAVAGPHPWPWLTFETFFGDGSVKSLVIPATGPRRFIRLRVE